MDSHGLPNLRLKRFWQDAKDAVRAAIRVRLCRDRERGVIILDKGDLVDIALVELDSDVSLGPGSGRVPVDDLWLWIDELWHLHDHI